MTVRVLLRRGTIIEAIHRVHVAVAEADGLLWSAGDPHYYTYWRSAAKPFQTATAVKAGAAEGLGLTDMDLAIMSASHNGQAEHIAAVASLLSRLGVDERALCCGTHPPLHKPTAQAMVRAGEPTTALHSNCSGKHAGMLALVAHLGVTRDGYERPEHPIQQAYLTQIADLCGVQRSAVGIGVDGCGVPVFALPLSGMARAYALLAQPAAAGASAAALDRVARAMTSYPFLVAGTGRLCTALMQATGGRLVAKSGHEGVYGVAVRDRGWGMAVKVEDGASRAVAPAVLGSLLKLRAISLAEAEPLIAEFAGPVKNNRNEVCGDVAAEIQLDEAKRRRDWK